MTMPARPLPREVTKVAEEMARAAQAHPGNPTPLRERARLQRHKLARLVDSGICGRADLLENAEALLAEAKQLLAIELCIAADLERVIKEELAKAGELPPPPRRKGGRGE